MNNNIETLFFDLWQKLIGYLPNLIAGILLLLVGWFIGWFIKRVIIQLLIVLRFDRFLIRLKWKSALSKADIRYAFYNLIGNFFFLIIFLIFLNSALDALQLTVFSKLIEQGVLFIPRLLVSCVILGIGWIIATRSSSAVLHALIKEKFPSSSLTSRFVKFIIILFFSAMALLEINIANEIVLIGFTSIMITLSAIIIITTYGSKDKIKNILLKKK